MFIRFLSKYTRLMKRNFVDFFRYRLFQSSAFSRLQIGYIYSASNLHKAIIMNHDYKKSYI